jgi:hypothetical protein
MAEHDAKNFSAMTKILCADRATLMSPRTAKYVEAMIRDDFDYDTWLKEVREEEIEAKQVEAAGTSGEEAAEKVDEPVCTLDDQHGRLVPPFRLVTQTARIPAAQPRPHCRAQSQTPKARPRRWLEKIRLACEHFKSSRKRDAVYGYLEAVFGIVMHYKVRRRTNRLLRHAFEFAHLPFDKNADAFAAIIRCTCCGGVDGKTISKWSRALRYASRRKKPEMRLKTFMKEVGGINSCANLYTKHFGQGQSR